MSLAKTWIEFHRSEELGLEAARAKALEGLNKKLGTNHTRGDLWRWEQGAGMQPDRREYMMREVIPYFAKMKGFKITKAQVEELLELLL